MNQMSQPMWFQYHSEESIFLPTQVGLIIYVKVNRLTSKFKLTACTGQKILYRSKLLVRKCHLV